MAVCWKCKHELQENVNVCSQCGAINRTTIVIEDDSVAKYPKLVRKALDSSKLLFISELSLKIADKKLVVPMDRRVIFGRDVLNTEGYIGIDLSQYKALELGVSRRHADLRRVGARRLILVDLGSTNGTRINDKRLTPFKAYALKDNDQIYFGNLMLTIELVGIALPAANANPT